MKTKTVTSPIAQILAPIIKRLAAPLAALLALIPSAAHAQAGMPLWTNRYNGPANSTDYGQALAVDGYNNVVVTGYSYGSGSSADYLIIQYSSTGVPLWTNRYNGPGNGEDIAWAVAVDGSNNIIVTGESTGNGSSKDYATIKYSNADVALWTNRYNGPGNGADQAFAVAVDGNNNVIVTGTSKPSADAYDYATIKYSSGGVPLWTNRYHGSGYSYDAATAVAVDGSNNVIVTGYSGGVSAYDYVTIQYSSAGVPLWTNRYNGPGNGSDRASAMVVDGSSNVIVTGESSPSVDLDYDYATIKYSSAGVPLWTNRYNGPGNGIDSATAMVVDGSDNVIVTGYSTGTGSYYDYATIKYSAAGVPLWTNRFTGVGSRDDTATSVAVDRSGNIIVTGWSTLSTDNPDYVTVQYSSAGVPLWTNRYDGPFHYYDEARAVAVDRSGNVIVTGNSASSGNGYDYVTIKYAGVPQTLPFITSQPLSRTNLMGTTATFSVTAIGDEPLKYQWRKGGTSILNGGRVSGVTTTNLVISSLQPGDPGDYAVVVTNAAGSVTSSVARLTVYSPGRFSNFAYSPAMGFTFVFRDATLGWPYRIQTSWSLAPGSWVDWVSFNYTAPIGFIDLSALDNTNRFYRAVTP